MDSSTEHFPYTYSADQRDEIVRIRQKYQTPVPSKLDELRQLDRRATRPGAVLSILLGVVSTLLFGTGMCCTTGWTSYFALGIGIGLAGLAGIALAYPVFLAVTKRQRKRLAPQILALTDERLPPV